MDVIKNIQGYVEEAVIVHNIPAISLAIWYEGVLHQGSAGCLNKTTGVVATVDSIFQIGSITKVMTSCLVMQLVDEGKIDLDKPVIHYLRDFMIADADASQSITVRQLLNHTNGIAGDYFPYDAGQQGNLIARYVDRCSLLPLVHPVGRMYSYSNAAFAIAGRLVEVVRGISWYSAMQEHIFQPLGMDHSIADPKDGIRYRCAMGHIYDGENLDRWLLPERACLTAGLAPAGTTVAMTAGDLIRFARAHIEGSSNQKGETWLSIESIQHMQCEQIELPNVSEISTTYAGLGWGICNFNCGGRTIGHSGATRGFLSMLQINPAQDAAYALLLNGISPSALEIINNDLMESIFDISIDRSEPELKSSIEGIKQVVGKYESFHSHIDVNINNGILVARIIYKIDPLPPLDLKLLHLQEGCFATYNNHNGIERRCSNLFFSKPDALGAPQYLFSGGRQNKRIG